MTLTIQILLFVALVLSILVPGTAFMLGEKNRGRFKTMLAVNLFTFFGHLGHHNVRRCGSGLCG